MSGTSIWRAGLDRSGRAAAAAKNLAALGAGPRRAVVVSTASSERLASVALASAALQAPFFPLDPSLPAVLLAQLAARAGDAIWLADAQSSVPGPALDLDRVFGGAACASLGFAPRRGPWLMMATSGSSGAPKAAVLTGDNLAASARAALAATPLGPGDRWLTSLPLFHIGGFSILARCALAGADIALTDRREPDALFAALARQRVTHVSLTPTMLAQLIALGPPPACLRHALVGGAALGAGLAAEAAARGWPVQPTYGMTETSAQIATLARLPAGWRGGEVGPPLPGVEWALTAQGRLKIRGPMVMSGYANSGGVPGEGLRDGWFETSDLAELSEDGALTVLGRGDETILTGGKKVQPAAVEALLENCPGLGRFIVAGRPDRLWGAIVTVLYDGPCAEDQLLAWCRAHIAGAHRPRAARRFQALPLLANGKIDRVRLKEIAFGRDAEAGAGGQAQNPAL